MDSPFSTPGTGKKTGDSFKTPDSQVASSSSKELELFKMPPSPSLLRNLTKRKAKVLDEEEYVERVEKIIERDFFPELDRIRARTEYIEASERNDAVAMRRLKERFTDGSRPGTGPLKRPFTPDTFDTPEEGSRQKDVAEEKQPKLDDDQKSVASTSSTDTSSGKKMSLDQFLALHTSEDNESFNEIQEEQFRKFRVDKAWMFKENEQLSIEMKRQELTLPSIEEQMKKTIEMEDPVSHPVCGFTYKNINPIFYNPDGVEMTPEELLVEQRKERSIVIENTRFKTNPWKGELQKDSLQQSMNSKMTKDAQKVGADGKALSDKPSTPSMNGFKFLRMTPSPMLREDESPLMTWGEVESTPYRLEGCETPLPMNTSGAGTSFSIQNVPKRDRIALELANKNSKFYRDKKGKAISKARQAIKTPKGSLTERVAGMSPAAQRLASNKLGIRLGTDKSLRAAYTPSPARIASARRDRTPTPSSSSSRKSSISGAITKGSAAAVGASPSPRIDSSSLTDNLLNLPTLSTSAKKSSASTSKKDSGGGSRSKAADFI